MDTVWGKVTWYSKLLALFLFVAMPFFGFYLGVKYGDVRNEATKLELQVKQNRDHSPRYSEAPLQVPASIQPDTSPQVLDTSSLPESETLAGWKTYRNEEYGFEFKYPIQWKIYAPEESLFWVVDTKGTGSFRVSKISKMNLSDFIKSESQRIQGLKDFLAAGVAADPIEISNPETTVFLGHEATLQYQATVGSDQKIITMPTLGLQISYSYYSDDKNDDRTADAILATFKFTK